MDCARCRHPNRAGRSYCSECGSELPRGCGACGFSNLPDERFCGGCGRALSAPGPALPELKHEGERRPVTILFADLSGYTRLSTTLDPEDLHRLLERFFEVADGAVLHFDGSIDKHIGDNVMAVFGAPVAHENDPERAVRAALAIHEAAARLEQELGMTIEVHVGIASGRVMASGTGSSHHKEYTVTGDAVNLAARLQDKARGRETMVSESVWQATRGLADFEAVGEIELKGLGAPVPVWKLIGLKARPEGRARTPFVGRRSEIRQILAVLSGCLDDSRGACIAVRGDAGLGKSRLLGELRLKAERLGFVWHQGQVLDFGAGAGGGAIACLTQSLLGAGAAGDSEGARPRIERAVAEGLISAAQALLLLEVLGAPLESEERQELAGLGAIARAELRVDALLTLVEQKSRLEPLLLCVEDVHWADASTLAYLARLAEVSARSRAVLLVTTRVDGDPLGDDFRRSNEHWALVRVELSPLREEECFALLRELGGDPDDTGGQRCVSRAGGNPLFLEQLLEARAGGDGIPSTLTSLVLSRVDRLPPEEKAALQVASVLGQRFEPATLEDLLGKPVELCGLVSRKLLRTDGSGFLFHHALIRDGVYASLTRARREQLHRAAADHYSGRDPVLHAEHLELAGAPAALSYLRAAQALAAAYDFERAASLVEHGIGIARDECELYALSDLRGRIAVEAATPDDAVRAYERALGAAQDDKQRCTALIGLGFAFRQLSRYEELLAALARAEPLAAEYGWQLQCAQIRYLRGSAYFALGRSQECLIEHEAALACARGVADPEWEARALSGLGDAHYSLGQMTLAGMHYDASIACCEAWGLARLANPNRLMRASVSLFSGDLAKAMEVAQRCLESVQRTFDRHAEIVVRHLFAMVHLLRGEYTEARVEAEASLSVGRRVGARRFDGESIALAALAAHGLGQRESALHGARAAVASAREYGLAFCGPMALGALAAVTEDETEARAALAEGEELVVSRPLPHNVFWFYVPALRYAVEHRDPVLAERYARALDQFARKDALSLCLLASEAARAFVLAPVDDERANRRALVEERARALGFELAIVTGTGSPAASS